PPSMSKALELWEDGPREQFDVLSRQGVRHAPELEQPHDDAGAQLLHVRLDLARHGVRIADERESLRLREIELELVERDVLGGPDHGRPWRRRLAKELHRPAM